MQSLFSYHWGITLEINIKRYLKITHTCSNAMWYLLREIFDFVIESLSSVQFSLVTQSCPTLCDPMNHSTPGLPVHHQLLEFTQTHVRWVSDAIQPSHPLSSPSPPAPNPSQHQSLFQWVNSSHEVAKVLELGFNNKTREPKKHKRWLQEKSL